MNEKRPFDRAARIFCVGAFVLCVSGVAVCFWAISALEPLTDPGFLEILGTLWAVVGFACLLVLALCFGLAAVSRNP